MYGEKKKEEEEEEKKRKMRRREGGGEIKSFKHRKQWVCHNLCWAALAM
jgi:hypothetical protein